MAVEGLVDGRGAAAQAVERPDRRVVIFPCIGAGDVLALAEWPGFEILEARHFQSREAAAGTDG